MAKRKPKARQRAESQHTGRRPIETEMAVLWQRMDSVADLFGALITSLVGSPRPFTLMVHPKDPYYSTISVTNTKENVEAVREWLRYVDERGFDDPDAPGPGSLLTDTQAIEDAKARGELVHPGALSHPV